MKLIEVFKRLFAIFSIVAVTFAPISVASVVQAAAEGGTALAMPEMPCCPNQTPALPDSQKSYPLAVLCSMCFPALPASSIGMPARYAVAHVRMPRDEIGRDLLLDPPPPKPPRT